MEEIKPFRFLLTFRIIGLDNFHLGYLNRIGKIKIVKAERLHICFDPIVKFIE